MSSMEAFGRIYFRIWLILFSLIELNFSVNALNIWKYLREKHENTWGWPWSKKTKVKEVDIACALIYAKELAHKEIELNKNKYKIEDTAAKA